jgi:hypothetical protein
VHGEQNGAIYQEVTLGRSDIAPVGLLAEDRADVLKRRINGKHGHHNSHLHHRHTARYARRSWALVLTVGLTYGPRMYTDSKYLPNGITKWIKDW